MYLPDRADRKPPGNFGIQRPFGRDARKGSEGTNLYPKQSRHPNQEPHQRRTYRKTELMY